MKRKNEARTPQFTSYASTSWMCLLVSEIRFLLFLLQLLMNSWHCRANTNRKGKIIFTTTNVTLIDNPNEEANKYDGRPLIKKWKTTEWFLPNVPRIWTHISVLTQSRTRRSARPSVRNILKHGIFFFFVEFQVFIRYVGVNCCCIVVISYCSTVPARPSATSSHILGLFFS